jgi:C1A family cysteine protease
MNDWGKMKSKCGGPYSIRARAFRAAGVSTIVTGLLFVLCAAALAQDAIRVAPMNPKYLEYMAKKESAWLAGKPMVAVPPQGHPTGHIPSPIDFSHLSESAASRPRLPASPIPNTFDLRNVGGVNHVTPVKNQGYCGACGTFAAIASVESTLMPAAATNLSEQFVIDTNGYTGADSGPCDGLFQLQITADMAAYGLVAQNLDPYEYWYPSDPTPKMVTNALTGYRLGSVAIIPTAWIKNTNPLKKSVNYIQDLIFYNNTAVSIGFTVNQDQKYMHTASNGDMCYYSGATVPAGGSGHGVAVVGWNDDYPASNFNIKPPGNGAWLIRNSWGEQFGNNGYCWMSYYEPSIDPEGYAYNDVDPPSTYDWTYQYDPLGWTHSIGTDSSTGMVANIFRAVPQGQVIRAVSFYTYSPNTTYTVKIYDAIAAGGQINSENPTVNPTGGKLLVTESGAFSWAGYNTHKLQTPVTVSLGKASSPVNFSVVVEITDPTGYQYPIAVQDAVAADDGIQPYSNWIALRSTAIMGQSYVMDANGDWLDLAKYKIGATSHSKACIKAFGSAK